jgi:IS605 OrfB family transposase
LKNNCGTINLESLSGIRQTSKAGGKTKANLHTWTFFELLTFIEYKAYELGIKVNIVDPKYTSQECPNCSSKNKVNSRNYKCSCGYKTHRDRLGALNIAKKSNLDGESLSA